ncbi:MAG: zf-HC2 domain-containing protein [Anaerolineales bacterium]|nr:zf-HC2 domain-containing protein [Anaerolineales bacterium]
MSDHIGSLLDAYLDHELSPVRMRAIEDHVADCEFCQKEIEQRRKLIVLLKDAPPVPAVHSKDQFAAIIQSQLMPRPAKPWTYQGVLRLGWQAVPVALLFTIIFIQTVFWLGNAMLIIPGGSDMLLGSIPGLPIEINLSDPIQIVVNLFRIYYFPAWDWLTGIIATLIISITYIAWMIIWWGQQQSTNNHRMAL